MAASIATCAVSSVPSAKSISSPTRSPIGPLPGLGRGVGEDGGLKGGQLGGEAVHLGLLSVLGRPQGGYRALVVVHQPFDSGQQGGVDFDPTVGQA